MACKSSHSTFGTNMMQVLQLVRLAKGTSWDEAGSKNEEIKPVAPVIIKLDFPETVHLSENKVSQSN